MQEIDIETSADMICSNIVRIVEWTDAQRQSWFRGGVAANLTDDVIINDI
jgi:hypothetical protein